MKFNTNDYENFFFFSNHSTKPCELNTFSEAKIDEFFDEYHIVFDLLIPYKNKENNTMQISFSYSFELCKHSSNELTICYQDINSPKVTINNYKLNNKIKEQLFNEALYLNANNNETSIQDFTKNLINNTINNQFSIIKNRTFLSDDFLKQNIQINFNSDFSNELKNNFSNTINQFFEHILTQSDNSDLELLNLLNCDLEQYQIDLARNCLKSISKKYEFHQLNKLITPKKEKENIVKIKI